VTLRVRASQPVTIEARGDSVLDATNAGTNQVTLSGVRGEALPLRIAYDNPGASGSFLEVRWNADGSAFSPIPADALRHSERDADWVDWAMLLNEL
jgi:hypothetical protein